MELRIIRKNEESACDETVKLEQNELCYNKRDIVTLEELIHPNMDTLRVWENGEFLCRQKKVIATIDCF